MSETRDRIDVTPRREGAARRLETELTLDAPPEAVWRALTEAQELTRWFPMQARVEPGAGGSIWMSWDGRAEGTNRIEIWEPGRHLRTAWFESGGPERLVVDYHLEGEVGRTVLRLVHHGFSADTEWDEMFDGIRRGWSFELRCLRHYLEHHRGVDRLVAQASRSIEPLPVAEAFRRLVSSRCLTAGGSLDGLVEGDRYAVTTATGEELAGTVLFRAEPTDLALVVESWNDAVLRLSVERWGGPDSPLEAHLWLETWGVEPQRVEALEKRWDGLLGELLAG